MFRMFDTVGTWRIATHAMSDTVTATASGRNIGEFGRDPAALSTAGFKSVHHAAATMTTCATTRSAAALN